MGREGAVRAISGVRVVRLTFSGNYFPTLAAHANQGVLRLHSAAPLSAQDDNAE